MIVKHSVFTEAYFKSHRWQQLKVSMMGNLKTIDHICFEERHKAHNLQIAQQNKGLPMCFTNFTTALVKT